MNEEALADKSFEELLELLNESVQALESHELTLEEMLAAYERSVRIVATCNKMLDEAELRVRQIDEILDDGERHDRLAQDEIK